MADICTDAADSLKSTDALLATFIGKLDTVGTDLGALANVNVLERGAGGAVGREDAVRDACGVGCGLAARLQEQVAAFVELVGGACGEAIKAGLGFREQAKANAVAPKITGVGATTVDRQVNSTFVSTASSVISGIVNKANTSISSVWRRLWPGRSPAGTG